MGWTTPTDRTTGYVPTAADWNVIEDDLAYLYGDSAWTTVTVFTNSWAGGTGTNTPQYILIGRFVAMRGYVQGGTLGQAAFTLPVGYRPSSPLFYPTVANNAFGQLEITAAGAVIPQTGSTSLFNIYGVFPIV